MALDHKTFTINEWASMTLDQWASFALDPTDQGARYYVEAAAVYTAGAEAAQTFTPGAEAGGVIQ